MKSIYLIPKQNNGRKKKSHKRALGVFDFQKFVDETYGEFKAGKSTNDIFETYGIVNRQKNEYEVRIVNKFLSEGDNSGDYRFLSRIADLKGAKEAKLGFVYLIRVNDKIKIGKTKNFFNRMNSYKSHAGETPKTIKVWFGVNYSEREEDLIKKFGSRGITKEWYSIDMMTELLEHIENY